MKKLLLRFPFFLLLSIMILTCCSTVSMAGRRPTRHHETRRAPRLPGNNIRVMVKNKPYFYHGGIFYRRSGPGFVRVASPVGARITVLPRLAVRLEIGGVPHWHYYGTYYRYDRAKRVYVVVEKPEEEPVEELTADKIVLVDGDILYGLYKGGDENTIKFENNGEILEIPIVDVVSVAFEPLPVLEEENGE